MSLEANEDLTLLNFNKNDAINLYEKFYEKDTKEILEKIKQKAKKGEDELILIGELNNHVWRLLERRGFEIDCKTDNEGEITCIWW